MSTQELREVTVFASGDPEAPSTWSNIPYYLLDALRRHGVEVNPVSIAPSRLYKSLYDATVRFPLRALRPQSTYSYFRTPLHDWDVARRVTKAISTFPNSQLNLFLTFSFAASTNCPVPSVQICDWPLEYKIGHFLRRGPDWLEQGAIRREHRAMERSRLVISLFAGVHRHLTARYPNARTAYLGHVINTKRTPDAEHVLNLKESSHKILFIGGQRYLSGARKLAEAFRALKPHREELELHVVGITAKQLDMPTTGLICYGYLDKGDPAAESLYYDLVQGARVIVNPTARWGGFSSVVEAMYFYTPVVTTRYSEFVATFGDSIPFGAYCDDDSLGSLISAIEVHLADVGYRERCSEAHKASRPHTWSAFVAKLASELGFALPAMG